jgi:nitroimidazol reductase NimA-like FMN-containing flavoprotein (pyridoxamine 5'-phosphate oxidase superfamily)
MNDRRYAQVNRHKERARTELSDLFDVLDAGHHVATLSTVVDGQPLVVPMLYGRDRDRIVLHGSAGAGALRCVAQGAAAALAVTHVDGWVYAHDGFNSSANYRSAVVHGNLRELSGDDAVDALAILMECTLPGRAAEVPVHSNRKQIAATTALAMDITEGNWTVKVRHQPPGSPGPSENDDRNLWTGTLPIRWTYGDPIPSPHVPPGTAVSPSVLALIEG